MEQSAPVLRIDGLRVDFRMRGRTNRAVDGVSFALNKGEILCIVGESGSGKSVTALSIMGLLNVPPAEIVSGEILYKGMDLLKCGEKEMRQIRGGQIAMIFQEPMTSLNPLYPVGKQIAEAIRLHKHVNAKEAQTLAVELLKKVGIPSPERRIHDYPHQMSGGMLQRVMIAMALSCGGQVLIADEPTTALDVTIQAQILDLIAGLKEESMSILLITHDLGVVAEMADNVIVMYMGQIMEKARVDELFDSPAHPYTEGLLKSIPRLGQNEERLHVIPGSISDDAPEKGCRFYPRCEYATEKCAVSVPPLFRLAKGRLSRCWLRENEGVAEDEQ